MFQNTQNNLSHNKIKIGDAIFIHYIFIMLNVIVVNIHAYIINGLLERDIVRNSRVSFLRCHASSATVLDLESFPSC